MIMVMSGEVHYCPVCHAETSNLALVDQLITWELSADGNELVETYWHKRCYKAGPTSSSAPGGG
jgi:hypothetical protein